MPINLAWKRPKNVEISPKDVAVSDVHFAADLMDDVIGQRGIREPIKSMLERAYRDLSRMNPKWTRRRVRAVFNLEASRIDHREIAEMQAVITARKAHAEFREDTARLASVHLARSADRLGGEGSRAGG